MDELEEYLRSLSDDIKNSIVWYTGGEYDEFNKSLRENRDLKNTTYKKHYENLLLAFQGVPPLSEPIVVYKGKKSDKVHKNEKAFVSTSLYITGTRDFHGNKCCILKITVPPRSKILPIYLLSDIQSEGEILLNRNGNYSITGTDIEPIRDNFNELFDMKFIYCVYTPEETINIGKDVDKVKDIGKKDINLIQERIIEYLNSQKEDEEFDPDFFDIDVEIDNILQKLKVEITDIVRNAIKMRVNST